MTQARLDPLGLRPDQRAGRPGPFLDRTAALVVLGTRHRPGLGRMVLGSHAVRIVHDAAVPALVVPMPPHV